MAKITTVDEYIAGQPEGVQDKLKELRQLVKDEAPQATEKISHGMPYYDLNGRLAFFGAQKGHITLMVTPGAITSLSDELAGYQTSKAAIQFPLDEPLPLPLIRQVVAWQVEENSKGK